MADEELEGIKREYLELVIGKPHSKTWPNHVVTDIIWIHRDGILVPHVRCESTNPKDKSIYNKALDTWLSDNGY